MNAARKMGERQWNGLDIPHQPEFSPELGKKRAAFKGQEGSCEGQLEAASSVGCVHRWKSILSVFFTFFHKLN